MEWNNPFSTINSAFAKISLFAWWPFTIPLWSLRENWMWENSFVAAISMVLLNLCAKKKKVSVFSSFLTIDTMFYKQRSCSLFECDLRRNFWVLIWSWSCSFELFKAQLGVKYHRNLLSLPSACLRGGASRNRFWPAKNGYRWTFFSASYLF